MDKKSINKKSNSRLKSSRQICRLCLSGTPRGSVFNNKEGLHQWISDYLSIKIFAGDGMSHGICAGCQLQLTEFHRYRMRCLDVQRLLQSQLQIDPQFQCPECRKVLNDDKQLYQHMRNHGSPAKCDICRKVCKSKKLLKDHKRMHGPKRFDCTRCEKSFVRRHHLHSHLIRFHKVRIEDEERKKNDKPTKKARAKYRRRKSNKSPQWQTETVSKNSKLGLQDAANRMHVGAKDQKAYENTKTQYGKPCVHRLTISLRSRKQKYDQDCEQCEQLRKEPTVTNVGKPTNAVCKIEMNTMNSLSSQDCGANKPVVPKHEDTKFNGETPPPLNGLQVASIPGLVFLFEVGNIKTEPE